MVSACHKYIYIEHILTYYLYFLIPAKKVKLNIISIKQNHLKTWDVGNNRVLAGFVNKTRHKKEQLVHKTRFINQGKIYLEVLSAC